MAESSNIYGRIARYYGTTEDDPRLFKLVGKIVDKGMEPTQWLDSKIGKRTDAPDVHGFDSRQDTSSMRGSLGGVRQKDVAAKDIQQGVPLPPTEDERLGIDGGLAEPGIGTKIAFGAADPSTRRQVLRGVSDTATFGLAEKLGNAADPDFAATAARDQEQADDARDYGGIAGAIMPGAAGTVGRVAGKGISALSRLGAAAGNAAGGGVGALVGGGLGGAVGGAAAAPVVGGLIAGGQAAVNGPIVDAPRAALEGAKSTATDPLQMAGGVALGALGGLSAGVRRGDGRTGEDIRLVEEFGGQPSLLRGASGGSFEAPVLKSRRGTTADVGEVAREAGDSIRSGLNAKTAKLERDFGEGKRRIAIDEFVATPDGPPQTARRDQTSVTRQIPRESMEQLGSRPRTPEPDAGGLDVSPIRQAAEKLIESKRLPKSAKAAIKSEVLDEIETSGGRMSAEELNDFRGKLQDLAKFGEPGSQSHFRALHRAAKEIVDDTGFGELNATYSKGIEAQKRRHRQLGIGKNITKTDIEDPIAGKKAARVVRRQDENTATSGQESKDVKRFIAENPEFKEQLAASRLMSAKGRLRLGVPDSGGLYERVGGMATRNIEPILGSAVYPAGKAVGDTGAATAPSIIKLLEDAMAQRKRRDDERARQLRGQ